MVRFSISKSAVVTSVVSIALHAGAAVFVRSEPAPRQATPAPPSAPIDIEQPLAADVEPDAKPESPPVSEPKTASRSPAANAHVATFKVSAPSKAAPVDPVTDATDARPSPVHFVLPIAVGAVATTPSFASASAAAGPSTDAPLRESSASTPARLVARAPLVYPPGARAAQIETDVRVEIVVDTAGHVVSARALTEAGYGLEDAAVRAVRGYRFSPATKNGRAVAVQMHWTVQFRLD